MYYLSFDIGTTSLKTALINDDGRLLAMHTAEYSLITPRADWAEMTAEQYWQAAVDGTHAVLARSGADASGLAAIGFSSQGQTFIPIDKAGHALYNAIVWVDNRAQYIADAWEADWLSRERYQQISGYPWIPAGLTLFKIAWLAEHAPRAHRAWKFLCLPDYLLYRLTGETATDRVIAQFSGIYNIATGQWDPDLLAAAGITAEQLPHILEPGEPGGHLRADVAAELGLPAGVPVCVGANDQLVGAVGAGNVQPGIVTETTGTSLALIATTPKQLVDNRIVVGMHANPTVHFALAFTVTSAIVLKWLRDLCAPGEDYDTFLAGAASIPPGSEGLTLLPHFAGGGCPDFNPHVRGAFSGLSLGHTKDHLARAVMESCACMLQECLDVVTEHDLRITGVRSLGGAARSDTWLQIKADMLGISVERPVCSDAASLGAAVLAATGIGRFASVEEGALAWYRPDRVFTPDPARHAIYREVYARYRDLYQRLYGDQKVQV
ncbi:MAG TPA: FGGY family carbohydrate kinase [Armatimonadota bacterium]|jgi:xylulokinase